MADREMLCLPVPEGVSQAEVYPLCDGSGLALAEALLEQDANRAERRLAEAIQLDPALAAWGRAIDGKAGGGCAASIDELARRLLPILAERLAWPSGGEAIVASGARLKKWADGAARAVAGAWRAMQAAGGDDCSTSTEYLNALVACWGQSPGAPKGRLPAAIKAAADAAKAHWLKAASEARSVLPGAAAVVRQLREHAAQAARQLEAAKLEALKEFAYGAGHELNNPLANIATRAQMLLKEESHPERRRRLAAINSQAFRAHEMLADMMLFARPPEPRPQPVDLAALAAEIVAELHDRAAEQGTTIDCGDSSPQAWAEVDGTQIRVALRALCINSIEALGEGGRVTVSVQERGREAELVVADDGPGIAPEMREKIFDPFFSGREAGRGLGFGLSKCWRIVSLHGGRIEVGQNRPRGAVFVVRLPVKSAIACTCPPAG